MEQSNHLHQMNNAIDDLFNLYDYDTTALAQAFRNDRAALTDLKHLFVDLREVVTLACDRSEFVL
ncbi:hypothetical protein WH43_05895 [Rheinheimera sp. KL1]|uniref:hypothetical protein n=1 Tax=Rheinheimera sp. KL1 TaxID=1635005 RepID=UPI0006A9F54C|nr:hypothetical protein [Rheinheimera sp. KL1]KOO59110.1 hypothetical protein WH43_05895 [Rheinheimera sp. KL1]